MNREEIDYWLKSFSNHNQSFMSKDGKKITLFKVFQELKELQRLLKIKNDYINELEKENQELKKQLEEANEELELVRCDLHNRTSERDSYYRNIEILQKENKKLKEVIDKSIDYISSNDIEVLKYHDVPSETSSYEIVTVDLLKILKGENNNKFGGVI